MRQFSAHVAGLIEKISDSAVPIRALFTMIRPDSKAVNSPRSYVQRTFRLATFFVLIWSSGEKRCDAGVLL